MPLLDRVVHGIPAVGCACAVMVLATATPSVRAQQSIAAASVWAGGGGYWSDARAWRNYLTHWPYPIGFWIDGNNPQHSSVLLDINASIVSLTIDPDDSLTILDGRALMVQNFSAGSLLNAGLLRIGGDTQTSALTVGIGSSLQVGGSGHIELSSAMFSRIGSSGVNAPLNNLDNTIRGAGMIGDGWLDLTNGGTIDADVPLDLLTVVPSDDGVANTGILQASNGGNLRLWAGEYTNSGGVIRALHNSHVDLVDASILGGTLTTEGNGVIRSHAAPVSWRDLTNQGRFELGLTRLTLRGQIINDGVIDVLAASTFSPGPTVFAEVILPAGSGDVSLEGSGLLRLNWTKVHSGSASAGARLVHGENHTIAGEGIFGANTIGLINHGTIVADRVNPLVLDLVDSQQVVNSGTIRAAGVGGIVLGGGNYRNDGVIEVLPGSRVIYSATAHEANISNSTLTGGTWRVIAGEQSALLLIPTVSVLFNGADVTLSGPGSTFTLLDTMLVNFGRFALEQGRNFTPQGGFFSNDGELSIGPNCLMTVNGEFAQSSGGVLAFALSNGAIDDASGTRLRVNGTAQLGGTLRLTLANGFVPLAGQTLHLVSADSLQGSFDHVVLPAGLTVHTLAGDVVVQATPICAGDIQASGGVDMDDLTQLLAQWGACSGTSGDCSGDLNGDGTVDVADLLMILSAWGPCE